MLVEFSVTNFRSIHERQTLSLVAKAGDELRMGSVVESDAPATPDLLRSAVIYGPNAAGKSNLILAMSFLRDLVVNSAQNSQQGDEIDVTPFLMGGDDAACKPSEFELIFVEQGVRYQYGVALTRNRVESEWLVAYPKGSPQMWFERDTDSGENWKFGPSFKGQRKLWQESTRDNALFLSTAIQLKSEQLMPVFEWFRKRLRLINPYARVMPTFSIQECERDESVSMQIVDFLKSADLGIHGVKIDRRKFDGSMLPKDIPESFRRELLKDMENSEVADVRLIHRTPEGKDVALDMDDESGGTQKIFDLAGPLLDVLRNGWVLVIDELDTSLHPLLMRRLVQMFHDPAINRNRAQLVFSTHDTTILDREVFRRDQVWFVEKDRKLQTRLYPLTDFSPRKDENFGRGYLQGRYGALPFIGEWRI